MREILAGAALAALLALPATAGAVTLKPGDILVAEQDGPSLGVIKVDPRTGQQSVVSTNATSSSDHFLDPQDLVLLPNGRILVIDDDAANEANNGALIEVNPATGQQRLIASNATSDLDLFQNPTGVAVRPDGSIVVTDEDSQGLGSEGAVIAAGRDGQLSFISNNSISDLDLFRSPTRLVIEPNGRIVLADLSDAGDDNGGVVAVDPSTGQQSVVSNNAVSAADLFATPVGIERLPDGRLLVGDTLDSSQGGGLIAINPVTGQQAMISNDAISDQDHLEDPWDVFRAPDGRILVADLSGADGITGAIISVNLQTGRQRVVSSNAISTQDHFSNPAGVAVVPPKCFGRFATQVGTPGRDDLRGRPGPDVIVGLGGNDFIYTQGDHQDLICAGPGDDTVRSWGGADKVHGQGGRDDIRPGAGSDLVHGGGDRDVVRAIAGKDRVFGGPGRDSLFGGHGRDRLFGQAGPDFLVGGPQKDRCFGGPGRDRFRKC